MGSETDFVWGKIHFCCSSLHALRTNITQRHESDDFWILIHQKTKISNLQKTW